MNPMHIGDNEVRQVLAQYAPGRNPKGNYGALRRFAHRLARQKGLEIRSEPFARRWRIEAAWLEGSPAYDLPGMNRQRKAEMVASHYWRSWKAAVKGLAQMPDLPGDATRF